MKDYKKEIEACEFKILQCNEAIEKTKDKIKLMKQKIRKLKTQQQKNERKKILKLIDDNKITTANEFEKILDAAQFQSEQNEDTQD